MQWMMLQQSTANDFVIATGIQYSVRQFIEKTSAALGKKITWSGSGIEETGSWDGNVVVRIDPHFFRPAEVETLLGDPAKAKAELGWVPEITLDEMIQEMVASDLREAQKHVLLQQNGFAVNISTE